MTQHIGSASRQKMSLPVVLLSAALVWSAGGEVVCNFSLLHQGVVLGDMALLSEAIRIGEDLYTEDCNGKTAMELALRLEDDEAAKRLLDASYDLDHVDGYGNTLLSRAARRGSKCLVEKLIEMGSTVDVLSSNGMTPFLEALLSGRDDVVELLLKARAKLFFRLPDGSTYLHKVAELGNYQAAKKLLTFGSPVDTVNDYDETPLSIAVRKNNEKFVRLLVEHDADVWRRNRLGETYLHLAARSNSVQVFHELLWGGIFVDEENNAGETALFYAVTENYKEAVRILLISGARLNFVNKYGMTYLHAVFGDRDMMIRFLELGINPDARDSKGRTVLRLAVEKDDTTIIAILQLFGSDLNQRFPLHISNLGDIQDATLLHLAAANGSIYSIEYLARHGVAINTKCSSYTALDITIIEYTLRFAERLLELGACDDYEASGCEQSYSLALLRSGHLAKLIQAKKKTHTDSKNTVEKNYGQ